MTRVALLALVVMGGSVVACPAESSGRRDAENDSLSILYLANEGVLIEAGGSRVLIDGLHRPYQPIYSSLPADVSHQLETATPPFDSVDLVLVSHRHRDHFHPKSVARYLQASPNAILASSPQVVRETLAEATDLNPNRIVSILPSAGESITRRFDNITVEFLGLSHGGGRHRSVQNLGHIIHVAGKKVLHVGDAVLEPTTFQSLALRRQNIDVALVPYWYLFDPERLRRVREEIAPGLVVAIHVPPEDIAEIEAQVREIWPEAIVFSRSLVSRVTLPAHA